MFNLLNFQRISSGLHRLSFEFQRNEPSISPPDTAEKISNVLLKPWRAINGKCITISNGPPCITISTELPRHYVESNTHHVIAKIFYGALALIIAPLILLGMGIAAFSHSHKVTYGDYLSSLSGSQVTPDLLTRYANWIRAQVPFPVPDAFINEELNVIPHSGRVDETLLFSDGNKRMLTELLRQLHLRQLQEFAISRPSPQEFIPDTVHNVEGPKEATAIRNNEAVLSPSRNEGIIAQPLAMQNRNIIPFTDALHRTNLRNDLPPAADFLAPRTDSQSTTTHTSGFPLPLEIVENIFSFEKYPEIARTAHVLAFSYRNALPNDGILDLSKSTHITDQDLFNIIKEGKDRIVSLNLTGCYKITDEGLKHIASLRHLTTLNLEGCFKITDRGLKHLAVLQRLTTLNLSRCHQITDNGLVYIGALQQLKTLILIGGYQITDQGLAHIATLQQLTKLILIGSCLITDNGLKHLTALKQLRTLSLAGCHLITDNGLAYIATLQQLRSLNLALCKQITNAGLVHIAVLGHLTRLNLSYCSQITDEGLAHIAAIGLLTKLYLNHCHLITDVGLAYLATLQQLITLNLYRCYQITNTGLAHIAALQQLKALHLERCYKITDEGLIHLSSLEKLITLDLMDCWDITDAGLKYLAALPLLTTLTLYGCFRITQAGYENFRELQHQKYQQSVVKSLDQSNMLGNNTLFPKAHVPPLHMLIADYV